MLQDDPHMTPLTNEQPMACTLPNIEDRHTHIPLRLVFYTTSGVAVQETLGLYLTYPGKSWHAALKVNRVPDRLTCQPSNSLVINTLSLTLSQRYNIDGHSHTYTP